MYHIQHPKNFPNLQITALHICIAMGSYFDYGVVTLTFPLHLIIQCIIVVLILGLKLNMCNSLYLKPSTQK